MAEQMEEARDAAWEWWYGNGAHAASSTSYHTAFVEGWDAGRAAERERIVAWLREHNHIAEWHRAADRIERGEELRDSTAAQPES